MPGLLISGPAGAGKTEAAREEMAARLAPAVMVDFQTLYAALLGIQRLPNGRYPERLERDAYALALAEYTRHAIITGATQREIDVITTNSDGNPARRHRLLGLLGPGAVERVIDPGRAVIEARLSDSITGVLSQQCKDAEGRWYNRI